MKDKGPEPQQYAPPHRRRVADLFNLNGRVVAARGALASVRPRLSQR